ncbi:MAG: hypothetical protein A2268_14900 [Candidatus Raymondbacteria bacterium RifOxyA12_full_50_37]|uniref:LytR/CpsA/Psr regulator C-terminal domain-containing protein n=1 Tax=Candidatus Raymondbacteria bacterium RIFOXYD12_FULL_49_13 TaxID=1817890 RepID=A0A1F7F2I3_UNCRA|nr:MAG: hypothetical protein A2268_14900 [Candidatus Raymondbacteria bacterium RifOxyA12_full_50_37]OGJ87849.1 MAG: hypothetical protein A2350_12845 [Candidatus Raymondbacteria bacterium RifOxyB12_full_50_8]OGJ88703.1 MAG: hypothetical protein A2248_20835 [Candidatus Raymondbacteria bacterium RIFOXYA2_FULL_49_16]OGK00875.1 MAG: hypothetical protein A2519_08090 [Candidatus Raymondbacteria bacterium RIFOXYD12_FULL_49_13]OGP41740.1 MAG: hypothetical protein A2324_07925 [Candidatus Raymondbacteria 
MKYLYVGLIVLLAGLGVFFFIQTKGHGASGGIAPSIPHIGSIQILNGCGKPGAAGVVGDFLRKKGFDVKETDNAPDWNYGETIVVSRSADTTVASQVAEALKTPNVMRLRNDQGLFDVTIFVGRDFNERVRTGTGK